MRTWVGRIYDKRYGQSESVAARYSFEHETLANPLAAAFGQYGERVKVILPFPSLVFHAGELYAEMLAHKLHGGLAHGLIALSVVGRYHAHGLAVDLGNDGVAGGIEHVVPAAYLLGKETYSLFWGVVIKHGGMEALRNEKTVGLRRLTKYDIFHVFSDYLFFMAAAAVSMLVFMAAAALFMLMLVFMTAAALFVVMLVLVAAAALFMVMLVLMAAAAVFVVMLVFVAAAAVSMSVVMTMAMMSFSQAQFREKEGVDKKECEDYGAAPRKP